jgi:hypothetical protein
MEQLEDGELDAMLEELRTKIERVRVLYEQFFMGTERTPPLSARKEVVRLVHVISQSRIRKAAPKFRFQSLVQRFNSHKAYWTRTEREIEMGTFKRGSARVRKAQPEREDSVLTVSDHLAINAVRAASGDDAAKAAHKSRMAQRTTERQTAVAEDQAAAAFLKEMGDDSFAEVASGRAPAQNPAERSKARSAPEQAVEQAPRPAVTAAAPPAAKSAADAIRGVSADDIANRAEKLKRLKRAMRSKQAPAASDPDRAIYERLVAVKQKLNQSTDSFSYERVQASLKQQRERLKAKHGEREVDFDVVVKDGKAFLKPIPTDGG